MTRSTSFSNFRPAPKSAQSSRQTTKGASDFLRSHDKMAVLLPSVARMIALQKDCATILPTIFESCNVLQFDSGQLVLSVPNAALAAKLKQQLPKLQDSLIKKGWQVNAIRLKVQVFRPQEKPAAEKRLVLPTRAVSALDTLNNELEDSPRNAALRAAIAAMVKRHRQPE
ncbi:DciA family protein [Noviherbaspirillum sp.]|uniref:DciA family protein n=1 Tax=Noviherbaspirillum sp. TaxID=1926288 RepID=UPI002DDDBA41|nr:DciA family protein [Noviherbaspirillum sp.]